MQQLDYSILPVTTTLNLDDETYTNSTVDAMKIDPSIEFDRPGEKKATQQQIHQYLSQLNPSGSIIQDLINVKFKFNIKTSCVAQYDTSLESSFYRALRQYRKGNQIQKQGRPKLLNDKMEIELIEWVKRLNQLGVYPYVQDLNYMAINLRNKYKNEENQLGSIDQTYGYNFVKRHSELKFGRSHNLDKMRARNCTQKVLAPFYIMLKELFGQYLPLPHFIGNIDESSISQFRGKSKLQISVIDDNAYSQPEQSTGIIGATIIPFITAVGSSFATCILLDAAKVPEELQMFTTQNLFFYPCGGWNTKDVFLDLFKSWIVPRGNKEEIDKWSLGKRITADY
ncbi:MAG: hypothetical protein EZS28_014659 [Streblomastix strix]|uniref:HTH CENPB-type domain-containing protein n=1 Tax=Streblomastix strix TaxID=222440 RepID=A0A5J4W4J8_9EUKA|nr:MAG: hypothetical protein EZS28_014659 [Streblomastix strix]